MTAPRGCVRSRFLLSAFEHLDPVGKDFHDLLRLNEHGRTGGRGIACTTAHIAAVFTLTGTTKRPFWVIFCKYLERSPEIMRLSVSRGLAGHAAQLSRRMLSSSGDALSGDLLLGDVDGGREDSSPGRGCRRAD